MRYGGRWIVRAQVVRVSPEGQQFGMGYLAHDDGAERAGHDDAVPGPDVRAWDVP